MNTVSVIELKEWIDSGKAFQLIDVREENEWNLTNLGGSLIPLSTIPQAIADIRRDIPVAVLCRSGRRSENAIRFLTEQHGYTNLYNITGGILAWSDQVDPTVPKY